MVEDGKWLMRMGKAVSQAFISSVLFGVNKGLNMVMTVKGGSIICRCIAKGMFEFLESRGLARPNMTDEELRDLLINKLGLAEDVEIAEKDEKLFVRVFRPTLTDFLEEMMKKEVPLVMCPYIATLIEVYSQRGVNLALHDAIQREYGIELVFVKK